MLMTSRITLRPTAGSRDESALKRVMPVTDADIEAMRRLGAFKLVVQQALNDRKPTPVLVLKGPASDSPVFGICKGYDGYQVILQTPETETPGFSVVGDRNPELEAARIKQFKLDIVAAARNEIPNRDVEEAIETMRRNKLRMFLPVHQLATGDVIARLIGLQPAALASETVAMQ